MRKIAIGVGAVLLAWGFFGLGLSRAAELPGIRTPWTLASDQVWRKSHRLGGYYFMAMAVLMVVIGFVAIPQRFPYLVGVVASLAVVPPVYSYLAWRREHEAAPSSTNPAGEQFDAIIAVADFGAPRHSRSG